MDVADTRHLRYAIQQRNVHPQNRIEQRLLVGEDVMRYTEFGDLQDLREGTAI
ncbi:hypothetical protein D3C71_2247980 [compost metagenome]